MDLEQVKARMKAVQQADDKAAYDAGHVAGVEWASETATPRQLTNLEEYEPYNGSWTTDLVAHRNHGEGIAGHLWEIVNPLCDVDFEEFWSEALGQEELCEHRIAAVLANVDFALGFVEGAMELWVKVEEDVRS